MKVRKRMYQCSKRSRNKFLKEVQTSTRKAKNSLLKEAEEDLSERCLEREP